MLDESRAEWLRTHWFHVGLSLDGNAAMHDMLRRFPDGHGSHAARAGAGSTREHGRRMRGMRSAAALHELVIAVADRVGATLYAESNPAFLARFYG